MNRALLIYNPAAGGMRAAGKHAARLADRLTAAGFHTSIEATRGAGHAERIAGRVAGQVDAVFSHGGDGTLRECAAGLLGSSTPLGFLPGGTANVMTRVLGIPSDPYRALDLLARGTTVQMDVGLSGERPFLMQVSAGLDAEALARLDSRRKRLLGTTEVALCALSSWWSYRYPAFEVSWEGGRREVTFAAVCNIPFYGGPWKMARQARWDDRAFDVVMFFGRGRRATAAFARDLALGRHQDRSDVETVRVDEVRLGPGENLSLQLDGDPVPRALPARIRLAPARIEMLVPAGSKG